MNESLWPIENIVHSDLDCLSGLIVAFAHYSRRAFEPAFVKPWGFFCQTRASKFDERFHLISVNQNSLFEQYCDIEISQLEIPNKFSLVQYCTENLITSPVIINIDAYDCPWCPIYRKYHFSHYLMITSFDENKFYCIDSYFPGQAVHQLYFDSLNLMTNDIIHFRLLTSSSNKDYDSLLHKTISTMEKYNISSSFKALKEYILAPEGLALEMEKYEKDVMFAPIFLFLKRICNNLKWFVKGLNYIESKQQSRGRYDCVKQNIDNTSKSYQVLINILLRNYMISRPNTHQIKQILTNTETQEMMAINSLFNIM